MRVRVQYVGHKPTKEDNVAGTGVVWLGHGDVQSVPEQAWGRLARHPDIWRLAEQDSAPPSKDLDPQTLGVVDLRPQEPVVHPTTVDIDGHAVPIAAVIDQAIAESRLTATQWEALAETERLEFIDAQVESLRLAARRARGKNRARGK